LIKDVLYAALLAVQIVSIDRNRNAPSLVPNHGFVFTTILKSVKFMLKGSL